MRKDNLIWVNLQQHSEQLSYSLLNFINSLVKAIAASDYSLINTLALDTDEAKIYYLHSQLRVGAKVNNYAILLSYDYEIVGGKVLANEAQNEE